MTRRPPGLKLRTRDGHVEWAEPVLRPVGDGGYGLAVDCTFGGVALTHWLAPDPERAGRLTFQNEPYGWPSAVAAFAARDQYAGQEEHGGEDDSEG